MLLIFLVGTNVFLSSVGLASLDRCISTDELGCSFYVIGLSFL